MDIEEKEIIKDINNDLKLNLLELKRQFQIYVNKKVEIINRLAFEAESDLVNFYKDEYILIPLFQEYYIKYFGDEKKTNLENEMYNNIINSSENLIDILLHKGIIELIKSFFGSKYHISNIIQIIKINYLDCTKNTLIKFSNLIKGYIGDLVDLFDFIWYNFEINFNEDQKNKWSSLKQFYGEKKKEILGENEIIEKYEKLFETKTDLNVFLDDYEKSVPIQKQSFMKILSVMPKKKSLALNYVSFSDTKTEVIEERKSIVRRRKTKLIEKDVFFKRNIPKANKYKPGFKLEKNEFQLFDDIFNGKVKIESLQPKLKEKTKLSKKSKENTLNEPQSSKLRAAKKEVKKCPESYEKLIERLSDGLILVSNTNTKPQPPKLNSPIKEEKKCPESHEIKLCPVKKEVKKCPESYQKLIERLSDGLIYFKKTNTKPQPPKLSSSKKEEKKCPESHEIKLCPVKKEIKKCPESHEIKLGSVKKDIKKYSESYEKLVDQLSDGFLSLIDFSEAPEKCVAPICKKEEKMKTCVDEKSSEPKDKKEESTLLRSRKKDRNTPPKSYLKLVEDMSSGVFLIKKKEDLKKIKKAKKGKEKVKSRYDVTFPIRKGRLSFLDLKTTDV